MRKSIFILVVACIFMLSNISVNASETDEEKVLVAVGDEMILMTENELDNLPETYALPTDIKTIKIQLMNSQIIPTYSLKGVPIADKGEVIYRLKFEVSVTLYNGRPATNQSISSVTTSTVAVVGMKTTPTNSNGIGYIEVDVRGNKSINMEARCGNMRASTTCTPTLRCNYQSQFYITGYIVALESDYSIGTKEPVNGLDPNKTYNSRFIAAVKLNGSGLAADGKYIKYVSNDNYMYFQPTTKSGTTPKGGTTVAVDPTIIPMNLVNGLWNRANIYINGFGNRVAEDTGGAIKQYKIDVFIGLGTSAMSTYPGNGYKTVTYINTTISR